MESLVDKHDIDVSSFAGWDPLQDYGQTDCVILPALSPFRPLWLPEWA